MGLFSALIKVTIDAATLPIDMAKDIATLGGIATEQDKPYTIQKLEQIKEDAEEANE